MRTDPRQERALDLATRGIGLVEDAALGVAAFAGEVELARARRIRCARGVELVGMPLKNDTSFNSAAA